MTRGVPRNPVPLDCAHCGTTFLPTNGNARNCSRECKRKRQRELRCERFRQSASRKCSRCQIVKPSPEFGDRSNSCKPCQAEYVKQYLKTNPGYRRNLTIARHGLTPESYREMLERQDGSCAVCRRVEPGGHGVWHIDHDHGCCPGSYGCARCVRGILCHYCNLMIGMAGEDPAVLTAAIRYLGDSMVYAKKKSGDPDFDDKVPLEQQIGERREVDGETVVIHEAVGPVGSDGSHRDLEPVEDADDRPDAKNADVPDGLEDRDDKAKERAEEDREAAMVEPEATTEFSADPAPASDLGSARSSRKSKSDR